MAQRSEEEARPRTRRTLSPVWAVSGPVEEYLETRSSSLCAYCVATCCSHHQDHSPTSLRTYTGEVRRLLRAKKSSSDELRTVQLIWNIIDRYIPCGWGGGRNP